VFIPEGLSKIF
jgi:hypothetical protein